MNQLDRYNVVWTTPSKDSSESMPVGGHDIGLNLWVENQDLLFYMQRSGCFDENNEYLKLGRVRLRLDPNPFGPDASFHQELKLREGCAEVNGVDGGLCATIRVWVEAHRPVIHIDVESSRAVSIEISYEGWRNEDVDLPDDDKNSRFGCFSWDMYPGRVTRYHDVVSHHDNSVLFHHRNRDDRLLFDYVVRQQGLERRKDNLVDTQKGRTFGGLLEGPGLVASGTGEGRYLSTPYKAWRLRSNEPRTSHTVKIYTHLDQTETLDGWLSGLNALATAEHPTDRDAWKRTQSWWEEFWSRSWLRINPDESGSSSKPWQIGRNYQLFRYQLGCNAFGSYPTKFNGGNFTYDPVLVSPQRTNTPDWRPWGGGSFTAQNQRLVHWPMLKSGDHEMMFPQFEFYRRALPNATARVDEYWSHEGCLFTEQMENFGLPLASAWGWLEPEARGRNRPGDFEHGVQVNNACIYHYESQLEFSYMILEYHRYSGADISRYMDLIKRSVVFFDHHYRMRCKKTTGEPLDENGKLMIYPSTSCESYKGARNPGDLIAGLGACIDALLALPSGYLSGGEREYFNGLRSRIPDYGYGEVEGERVILPAWSWTKYQNAECPQFYPLFPFNRFELGKDDLALFHNAWKHGAFPKGMVHSWHQDGIFLARMGMTTEAAEYNVRKMENSNRRFPTFWGPGADWVPDHNWGGSGMIGLQEMLMQTVGRTIQLFPAWPPEWNVDFKLHASHGTVVEGIYRSGSLTSLKVTPPERMKDVVIPEEMRS